jgi:four helix bundle protein
MNPKNQFVEKLKGRTKIFTIDMIKFCDTLKSSRAISVITYQVLKSASSIGANYRAACRARSRAEFFSKLCIVVEEADETEYWLEVIYESNLFKNKLENERLLNEANEIVKIMTSAKNTTYGK